MVVATNIVEENGEMETQNSSSEKRSIARNLIRLQKSPGSLDVPERVVIVMDALKEFSMGPLEWVLKNIALMACCSITLLGVMPWLNIPLSSKTWSDIWTFDLEDPLSITEKSEWKSDAKYQKIQRLIQICRKYGVVPEIKSEMGFPVRLLVVEQITTSHATLVVFDRYHDKKNINYYARKVPCNMFRMNDDGEVDMIKGGSHINNGDITPSESTGSSAPTLNLIISENLKKKFKLRTPKRLPRQIEREN